MKENKNSKESKIETGRESEKDQNHNRHIYEPYKKTDTKELKNDKPFVQQKGDKDLVKDSPLTEQE